jgi:ethanolamine permease
MAADFTGGWKRRMMGLILQGESRFMAGNAEQASVHLQQGMRFWKLWALMVGMVISGQYFGWSYGVGFAQHLGSFFFAVAIVVVFYVCLTLCCAELASFIPKAGGPSAYATLAFGERVGGLTGYFCLLEFFFAVPAIAVALGQYVHLLFPVMPSKLAALLGLLFVFWLNSRRIEKMASVELVATMVAVLGLVLFYVAGGEVVALTGLPTLDWSGRWHEVLKILPFTIWLFLAIEGGVMAAEEVENPQKTLVRGFLAALLTLIVCTVLTVFFSVMLAAKGVAVSDAPLLVALKLHTSQLSVGFSQAVAFCGVFGLLASLNGITLAYSRQAYALSQQGFLPLGMARLSRHGVPLLALLVPGAVLVCLVLAADMAKWLVDISVLGALMMYGMVFLSSIRLRVRHQDAAAAFHLPMFIAYLGLALAALLLLAVLRSFLLL